jgi:GDP-4-dehydro-6-deoxy-D-mannose reductase
LGTQRDSSGAAKRLLVTGRHGFVGGTLAGLIASDPALRAWELCEVPPELDLRDANATAALVAAVRPDAVIHLAALSFVPDAFKDPAATFDVNVIGTLRLLQALKAHGFVGRVLFVGTGDVYGLVPEDALPISEYRLPAPRNPYAVSKLAAEALCFQWAVTEGVEIVMARPFNHTGPGQSPAFFVPGFAGRIARAEADPTGDDDIAVGNLDSVRDFTDVRDVVRAYRLLVERGTPGEAYNVCSGEGVRIRALAERLLARARRPLHLRVDPELVRPVEVPVFVGDPAKLVGATGWTRTVALDTTLDDVLAEERERETA